MAERIGILGGTFDPPHLGHLVAAVNVRHALSLDRVLLVVANDPWQKSGDRSVSPADARMEMVRAAVTAVPGWTWLEASDIEIRRGGPSFTADTVTELREQHPDAELFVVLGRDAAAGLPTWERVEAVRSTAQFVVVDRPGSGEPLPEGWPLDIVSIPRLEISSTDLRARAVDGRPLDLLVAPAVVSVIEGRRLYRGVR